MHPKNQRQTAGWREAAAGPRGAHACWAVRHLSFPAAPWWGQGDAKFCPGQHPYLPLQVLMLFLPADRAGSQLAPNVPSSTLCPLRLLSGRGQGEQLAKWIASLSLSVSVPRLLCILRSPLNRINTWKSNVPQGPVRMRWLLLCGGYLGTHHSCALDSLPDSPSPPLVPGSVPERSVFSWL